MRDVALISPQRVRDPLLLLLILAGLFFGLAPLLAPKQFGDLFGFQAKDIFLYRLAGAATLGYGVSLLLGFRSPWREIRILIASTAVFNVSSIAACVVAIAQGGAQWVVYLILLASILFTAGTLYLLMNPPLRAGESDAPSGGRDVAQWIVALFAIGVAASLVFGLGPLVAGGGFGRALGFPGLDDFIYRQAGAATFGASVGGLIVLQTQRWRETRLPALAGVTFNATSAIAALIEIANGGAQPVAYVILVTAVVVTIGMALAVQRNGR